MLSIGFGWPTSCSNRHPAPNLQVSFINAMNDLARRLRLIDIDKLRGVRVAQCQTKVFRGIRRRKIEEKDAERRVTLNRIQAFIVMYRLLSNVTPRCRRSS